MLPDLHPSISGRFTKLEGVTVLVSEACTGCRACTQDVCFVNAIRMEGPTAVITDACRGCGRCVIACPQRAIRLTIEGGENLNNPAGLINQLVNVR
jgi:UDP-glucose 4-epimerase